MPTRSFRFLAFGLVVVILSPRPVEASLLFGRFLCPILTNSLESFSAVSSCNCDPKFSFLGINLDVSCTTTYGSLGVAVNRRKTTMTATSPNLECGGCSRQGQRASLEILFERQGFNPANMQAVDCTVKVGTEECTSCEASGNIAALDINFDCSNLLPNNWNGFPF